MKIIKFICLLFSIPICINGQNISGDFKNPILSGFNPDPSICRVNDDYYLVTSTFTWYPGLPIYHSKDLVNWKLIGHGINRPDMVPLKAIGDNDGIYAPTIRYHKGVYYIITTATKSGGNFYITATDPKGPWSDPIWLKNAPGIDPSLFFDDDGKCYYHGNIWGFPERSWKSQCAVWVQELDLEQRKLVGERKNISYGHANNAAFTEAPHLYKINGKYLLITSEGGTNQHHAVTVHHSNNIFGPYVSDKTNPVLTHRHLGKDHPIQATGHADLVQTQNGEWYAVLLAKRFFYGQIPLGRESFLCKIDFENGTPIFNKGFGKVLAEQKRPNLPWTPVEPEPETDEFNSPELGLKWNFVLVPKKKLYSIEKGKLSLFLQPESVDTFNSAAMIIQRTPYLEYSSVAKMNFKTNKESEQAGIILYRSYQGYYALMKGKDSISLIKKYNNKKQIIAQLPYKKADVHLKIVSNNGNLYFSFGETTDNMIKVGTEQTLEVISDNDRYNKFNGTGVGVYATSNGYESKNKAIYDWIQYRPIK